MTRGLGEQWLIEDVAIKPFPICHLLHACADAALALRRKHDLKPPTSRKCAPCSIPRRSTTSPNRRTCGASPVSDYMAKFSVQFVVAACLVRGSSVSPSSRPMR